MKKKDSPPRPEATEVLYVRVPTTLMDWVRAQAWKERRSVANWTVLLLERMATEGKEIPSE